MKIIIVLLLTISNLYASPNPDPSLYSNFNSYFQDLNTNNSNWINSSEDRNSLILKKYTNETIKADSLNAKIEALNKKIDLIQPPISASLQVYSNPGGGTVTVNIWRILHDSNNAVSGNSWIVPKTATYIITGNLVGNSTTPSLYIYRNGSIILTPSGSSSLSGNYYSFINGTEITLNQNDSITFGRNSGGGGTYSVGSVNIFEKK